MQIRLTKREREIVRGLVGDFLGLFENPKECIGDGLLEICQEEAQILYEKFPSSLSPSLHAKK